MDAREWNVVVEMRMSPIDSYTYEYTYENA